MFRLLPLALLALSTTASASEPHLASHRTLTVLHRLFIPSDIFSPAPGTEAPADPTWIERGRIEVAQEGWDGAAFAELAGAWDALDGLKEGLNALPEGARYQVAVRDPAWGGDAGTDEVLPFVSVDPCKLYTLPARSLDEHFALSFLPSSSSSEVEGAVSLFSGAFDYRTSTADDSGACTRGEAGEKERGKYVLGVGGKAGEKKSGRVTVGIERSREIKAEEVSRPVRPKEQKQQQPVQLDKDGKIIPPPVEKSFIQKYWIYIVPALLIIAFSGGDAPAEGGQGGGGGGAKGK
ncbi:hypothetical protein JCM8097_001225 [Rhodosporidiobolus ruineniae]